jgi:FkbM family methyltransferase
VPSISTTYWNTYRYIQAIDRRFLNMRFLRLGTPPDIDVAGRPVTIQSGLGRGLRWQHRPGYSHYFWTGTYDHAMQPAMKRYVRPGQVAYDIGGNAGFHALLFARLVGESGRVFCFEPLPENIEMIALQLGLNDMPWCEVVAAAVADQEGSAELYSGSTNGVASLVLGNRSGRPVAAQVKTLTLDEFCRENPPPDIIKMDIEGAEGLAIAGAQNMLASGARPVFFFEFHGPECVRAVVDGLLGHGYRFESFAGTPLTTAELRPRGYAVAVPR